MRKFLVLVLITLSLSACGSGGGSSESITTGQVSNEEIDRTLNPHGPILQPAGSAVRDQLFLFQFFFPTVPRLTGLKEELKEKELKTEVLMNCKLCVEMLLKMYLQSEKVGKVYSVEGKDMTYEFFKTFSEMAGVINTFDSFKGEKK